MLIVRVFEHEVESVLRSGEGPVLERGAVCPGCQGKLSPWGSYRRYVRQEAATQLRVRRAICNPASAVRSDSGHAEPVRTQYSCGFQALGARREPIWTRYTASPVALIDIRRSAYTAR